MRLFIINAMAVISVSAFIFFAPPVFAAGPGDTNEVIVYGTIQPSKKIVISGRAAGTIDYIPSIEGAEVKSGEVVLLIDKEDYELRAEVLKKQMQLAIINKEQADREFKRLDSLYSSKAISLQAKDAAYFAKEAAEANVGLMKSNLKVIEKNLRDTVSLSPVNGIVSARLREVGDYIAPGLPVIEIVNIESVKAVFKVPENFITKLGPGAKIEIFSENDTSVKTAAEVTSINPVGDADNHVFEIIILIDNPQRIFKAGMFVRGVLKLEDGSVKNAYDEKL